MRVGSLFAGIGGFDLAAEAVGWEVVWQAEIDPACAGWLAEHFGVPNLGDVSKVDWSVAPRVDVLCGGFPCQPHSTAGKKKGNTDERDLWPEIVRCVRVLRPRYCVFENVPGLLTTNGGRFFAGILRDLAEVGYDAEWFHISAADVGAPHERDRVWIVAYPVGRGREESRLSERRWRQDETTPNAVWAGEGVRGRPTPVGDTSDHGLTRSRGARTRGNGLTDASTDVVDAPGVRLPSRGGVKDLPSANGGSGRALSPLVACGSGGLVRGWEDATPFRGADGTIRLIPREAAETGPESPLWPVADGVPGRVARLSAIGNALVPAIPAFIFRAIQDSEKD